MSDSDIQFLFSRAERSYAEGSFDAARNDLSRVRSMAVDQPAVLHLSALVERKRGDTIAARKLFEQALRLNPADPQIINNLANLLTDMGEFVIALTHYDRALEIVPQFHAGRYNRALLLQKLGRHEDAVTDLEQVVAARHDEAKAHAALGTSLRLLGRLRDAAAAFEAALGIDPTRQIALHGRALIAKERGESGASQLYRRALAAAPADREIGLGLAEALEAEGSDEGLSLMNAMVAAMPDWWDGQSALARMRWEAGESANFARSLAEALVTEPKSRAGWLTYAGALAAAGRSAEAADAARAGRTAIGGDATLALLEAVHASECGQLERAERLFGSLPPNLPGRAIHEMRHRLRQGDYQHASRLAEQARLATAWDIGVWAMTGIVWRLLDDSRADWLLDQPGFVGTQDLEFEPSELAALATRLRSLHRSRAHPMGQSLRGGTQSRGRLFERDEAEIRDLQRRVINTIARYWDGLPSEDASHPLLRHRNAGPRLAGSWSVRLTDSGFHIAHMHPEGLVSSACHIVVPDAVDREGWLEIGGAPDGLALPIAPLHQLKPTPGRIALFPSYCYHGTRPFARGERLSVAFDIVVG